MEPRPLSGPWITIWQAPRPQATPVPPVDAVVERLMATYRTSSQADDGDFARGVVSGLKIVIPFWVLVIRWWLSR